VSWPKIVQSCVARLRKVLGAGAIVTEHQGYRLAVPADEIDAGRFERLLGRAQELLTLGEPERSAYLVEEALHLWRGEPYVELEGWEPGRVAATRLQELRLDAHELRLDAALQTGRHREVLAEAQAKVAEQPLREHRWEQLTLAQYQSGRQAEALATIRRARRVLADELGLDPGADILALEQAILRQDPALLAATAPPEASAACPYLGLVPYDISDADGFFGRDAEVSECLRRLAEVGVLAVVGPSGSGKSSLVRAGVAAALIRDRQRVVVITPGSRPVDSLNAVQVSGPAPVLVVDQCEEAITLCPDDDERSRFFMALADHVYRAPLIVALRADRFGELSAHPAFARLVEPGLYLLKRMDDSDLRAAIEGPARQAGLLLEPGLVDLLIRDVEGEPGAMPLLSHALRQTWVRREGRTLTVAGYQASGGIRGAVAQSAEAVYEQAPPERRSMLRDLLLRLVAPSPDGEPLRSRVPRRLVATDAEHEQVIEQLVRARLVISDEAVIEIAHEALARAWPRLRSWLDDDVEGQRVWRHLSAGADAWDAMARPASELYRGTRLAQAVEWRDRATPDLNRVEHDFLAASEQFAAEERRAAEEQARRQVRINRRLRALVAGIAVLALAAAAVGLVAVRQAERADTEADVVRSHELAASAISVMDDDPSLAKLLAVASATVGQPTLDSISALHRAWFADKVVDRYIWPADQALSGRWVDLDPESQRMVAHTNGDYLEVVDMSTGQRLWDRTVTPSGAGVEQFQIVGAFITDGGEYVVSGHQWFEIPDAREDERLSQSAGVYLWDASTGELVERFDTGPCGAELVAYAQPYAAVRSLSGHPAEYTCDWRNPLLTLELLDIRSGARDLLTERSMPSPSPGWGSAFSGDGRYLAFDEWDAGENGRVVVVDTFTGERSVLELSGAPEGWGVRALNSDGSLLLYGDLPMQVWDVARGELATSFENHDGESMFGAFASDGSTVYTTGVDGVLRHWDARTGQELRSFGAVSHGPIDILDRDRVLVSNVWQGHAAVIDFRPKGELGFVATCQGGVPPNALGVAGAMAAFPVRCGDDAAATTYGVSLEESEVVYALPGHQSDALVISPDGTRFVRLGGDSTMHGPLTVRDLGTGDILVELQPFGSEVKPIRWSPDGAMIAAEVNSKMVAVFDANNGRLLHAETGPSDRPYYVADAFFTSDSARLVVSAVPDGYRVFSTANWDAVDNLANLQSHGDTGLPTFLGYSPDESTILAVGGLQSTSTPGEQSAGTPGELNWLDPETFNLIRTKGKIHDRRTVAAALSPNRTRIATGSSDGIVRVWDSDTGELLHEIPLNGVAVHGIGFIDEYRLAITPADGNMLIVTTDPDELLDLVRSSLTRGFLPTECDRFNFGDNCPTLDDLRGTSA
jgi:WD40 repeat protein